MLQFRPLLIMIASAALLSACGDRDATVAVESSANPLLAHVPADTPYAFANLAPPPAEVVDAWLARMEPLILATEELLDEATADESPDAPDHERLLLAIQQELAGKLNRAGLESLGLSLETWNAFYGDGLTPVLRIGLGDANALRAAIDRVAARAGLTVEERQLDGTAYWRLGDEEFGAFVALLDQHVALSAAPRAAEAKFLPAFLGQDLPANALANGDALPRLNADHDYSDFGSGYVDFQRVADELLDPDSHTVQRLGELFDHGVEDLPPVCREEIRALIAHAPRATAGITELQPDRMGLSYQLDIESGLAAQLMRLPSAIPKASADPALPFAMALGIQVGRLRELLLEKVNQAVAEPFQCPRFARLNQRLGDLAAQLNQPYPLIGNLMGLRVELAELDPSRFEPEKARGRVALEVRNPQVLTGMASMIVPGVENLQLEPGGEPVQLPQELLTVVTPDLQVYAVMTSDAIGLALGAEQRDGLLPFLDREAQEDGTFLSLEYDSAAFLPPLEELPGSDGAPAGQDGARWDRHRELMEAYRAMLGRNRVEFRFVEEGLRVDTHMSFP